MNNPERTVRSSPTFKEAIALTGLAAMSFLTAGSITRHAGEGSHAMHAVISFEHEHPNRELPPELAQEQAKAYSELGLAGLETVFDLSLIGGGLLMTRRIRGR